jgi:hypothetical protein
LLPRLKVKAGAEFQTWLLASLLGPTAFLGLGNPFFRSTVRPNVWKPCHGLQRSRPQGLATLSTVSASPSLGNPFQFPTLLGFALQSFSPIPRSKHPFGCPFRSYAFRSHPLGLPLALQRLTPARSAVSLLRPGFLRTRAGSRALLSFGPLRLSSVEPMRKLLPSSFPSRPLPPPLSRSGEAGAPRFLLSTAQHLPSFEGCQPVWPS